MGDGRTDDTLNMQKALTSGAAVHFSSRYLQGQWRVGRSNQRAPIWRRVGQIIIEAQPPFSYPNTAVFTCRGGGMDLVTGGNLKVQIAQLPNS